MYLYIHIDTNMYMCMDMSKNTRTQQHTYQLFTTLLHGQHSIVNVDGAAATAVKHFKCWQHLKIRHTEHTDDKANY